MAKTLGITGGIGSGKSHMCKVFASLGCAVYDSDSRTKELYAENQELLDGLAGILGNVEGVVCLIEQLLIVRPHIAGMEEGTADADAVAAVFRVLGQKIP